MREERAPITSTVPLRALDEPSPYAEPPDVGGVELPALPVVRIFGLRPLTVLVLVAVVVGYLIGLGKLVTYSQSEVDRAGKELNAAGFGKTGNVP
jgi:hypothetical protein